MKILIFIIIMLNTTLLSFSIDKFSFYEKAFIYINNDSVYTRKEFSKLNRENICSSSEIVRFKRWIFIYDIVNYEYDITDTIRKFVIIDSLKELESEKKYNTFYYMKLSELNTFPSNCEYIVYFSDIIGYQFTVEIMYNESQCQSTLYEKVRKTAKVNVIYYFYFDEDHKIKKVFKNVLYY